jgi:uncharacterized glyoxalase superfamily protein PhnB
MMKSSELLLITDSVEEAIKFYTEKLAFDLVDTEHNKENPNTLLGASLRKGKCYIHIKAPQVEELAEFSFIKRCASRCVGIYIEMKKGIEKYYQRCQKKGVRVAGELKNITCGTTGSIYKTFSIRDPFGVKVVFAQLVDEKQPTSIDLAGMMITSNDVKSRKESELLNDMINHLRTFGVLRRAAKKYSKQKIKQLLGK